MSNDTNTTNPTATQPEPEVIEGVVVETTRTGKIRNFLTKHKETLVGSTVLVALVGVSAYAGRKSAPTIDTLEIHAALPLELPEDLVIDVPDDTVTN